MPTVVREAIHKSFSTAKNLYGNFAKLALVFPAMQFVSKIDLIWAHTKLHSEASWFPSFWARGKKKRATSRAWRRFGWQIVLFKACYQSLVNQVALLRAERWWEGLFDSQEIKHFCLPSHLTVFLKIILRTAKPLWLMFCFGPLRCNDATRRLNVLPFGDT